MSIVLLSMRGISNDLLSRSHSYGRFILDHNRLELSYFRFSINASQEIPSGTILIFYKSINTVCKLAIGWHMSISNMAAQVIKVP